MNHKKHIALIGLKSAGKTSVAKALVALCDGYEWVDSDACIEARYRQQFKESLSYRDIHYQLGDQVFREWEKDAVMMVLGQSRSTIIATGGSSMMDKDVAFHVCQRAKTIFLRASFDTLLKRWQNQMPGFVDPEKNLSQQLSAYHAKRDTHYLHLADWTIDVDDLAPEAIAQLIFKYVKE